MVFIWSGSGISVLIYFGLSAWLTSYSFDDVTLGNGAYMGWSMIWACIPTFLHTLALMAMTKDEVKLEPGEVPAKTKHAFMFIPVGIWAVILLAGGIYFVIKSPAEMEEETVQEIPEVENELEGERVINFWNPTDKTITVDATYNSSGEHRMTETIEPNNIRYATYVADYYDISFGNKKRKIKVEGGNCEDSTCYDQTWFLLDKNLDLVLIEVTDVCNTTINKGGIREINWLAKKPKRYEGGDLIEPVLKAKSGIYYRVVDPSFTLPTKVEEGQVIYSLVPIETGLKLTEAYLDSMIIDLCF